MKKMMTSLVLVLALVSTSAFAGHHKDKKIFRATYCGMKTMAKDIDAITSKGSDRDFSVRFIADAFKLKVEREYNDTYGIVEGNEQIKNDSRIKSVNEWQGKLANREFTAEHFNELVKGQLSVDLLPAMGNDIACEDGGSVRGYL